MTSSPGLEFITSHFHGECCQSSLKVRFGNSQLQPSLFVPDLTLRSIQEPYSPIVRIPPFSGIGILITVWNQ